MKKTVFFSNYQVQIILQLTYKSLQTFQVVAQVYSKNNCFWTGEKQEELKIPV